MGRQILSFGVAATHARITPLSQFEDVVCVSDYEAFVVDPQTLGARALVSGPALSRRQSEIRDLVRRKGGLSLCFLRPPFGVRVDTGGTVDGLSLFDSAAVGVIGLMRPALRMGTATKWGLGKTTKGVTWGYLRALAARSRPEAFLELEEEAVQKWGGVVVAANSAGWPISVEFVCGTGRLCFVPVTTGVPEGQLGSAIARMVEEHFGGPVDVEEPGWVDGVSVPSADANNARIAELEKQRDDIAVELSVLTEERSRLLDFRVLLFGYGKSLLEPVVRRALRELGFKVLEAEEYEGEWDVDLTEEGTGGSAVGEVEGSEGAINVDKLRQLLDYVEAEENDGRRRKGILIGNGYRLKGLSEPERGEQFTEMAVKRAKGFEYCLLPTNELFAAVCAVLKSPKDEALKKRIRDSLLSTVGVWKFTEGTATGGGAAAGEG
jgi:hypothetical protein